MPARQPPPAGAEKPPPTTPVRPSANETIAPPPIRHERGHFPEPENCTTRARNRSKPPRQYDTSPEIPVQNPAKCPSVCPPLRPERGNSSTRYDANSVKPSKPLRQEFGRLYDQRKSRNRKPSKFRCAAGRRIRARSRAPGTFHRPQSRTSPTTPDCPHYK